MSFFRDQPLWQLMLARWRGFFREPGTIFWSMLFPLVLSAALGVAFRVRPPAPVRVGVPLAAAANDTRAMLERAGLVVVPCERRTCERLLRSGDLGVLVEPGAVTGLRFDPSRTEGRLARALVEDAMQRAAGRRDVVTIAQRAVTERGSRYVDFLVPGLLGMNIMQGGLWAVGFVLADMRSRKLLRRLAATPMRRSDFLLSFLLTRVSFVVLEVGLLLGIAATIFQVPIRGSVPLVIALGMLGSFAFSSLGLLAGSRAQNTQSVSGLVNLLSMPMMLLSGVFFPSTLFPEAIQPVIRALPLTALNDAIRAIMLDGAGVAHVAMPALVLAVWAAIASTLALKWFRWQ